MLPIFPPALQTPEPAAAQDHGLPCDAKDHQALLIGDCTREEILAHRAVFKEHTDQAELSDADRARWMAIQRPFTIVAAFGSWCGDSQRELPSFLKLDAEPNPFVEVQFIGVARDKAIEAKAWPAGVPAQKAERVPTAWVFALGPGGAQTLVGSVVEHPAKAGETFAESILDVMERAR
jgi:thiol-disulfide isomerase/thioredoxin